MAVFSTAIGGLLGGTFLSSAVGSFLLKVAVGVGFNLLAGAIAGQPEKPSFSVQGQLQAGGDLARSFVLGRTATAGSLVYANTWGNAGKTPNAYFTQVIAVSDLPVQEVGLVWVNGEPCNAIAGADHPEFGTPLQQYRKGGKDHLWIKFYDGTQTQADGFLVSRVSSSDRPYEATRVGFGISYAICTALVNEELFTGFPQYKFEIAKGVRLYDPSRDSSVGGVGPQRLADPATWGGDGDHYPAVQAYNTLLGFKYGGSWFYGVQNMAAARLPVADWIAQINKCRAQVAAPGGGTEEQYLTGLEIQVNAPIADALEAYASGCQGRIIETGGTYKMRLGAPDLPVASFTDGEIISTERQSFTPFFGLAETINGIAATYPDPAEGWNAKAAPALYRADLEVKAGNRRLMADVSLGAVYRPSQVQRLMKSALEEAQRARRHTFTLPPGFWALEPGDIVDWTSERTGYVNKLFRVDGVVDKANLDIVVDLTEVDPSDWVPSTDYRAPTYGPISMVRPAPQPIADWYARAEPIRDNASGARRPGILVLWDGDQDGVDAVIFQIRLTETLDIVYEGRTDTPEKGSIHIGQNLLPKTQYGVRGRYVVSTNNRPMEWSGWLVVTTDNILLTDEDVYLPGLVEEVNQTTARALEFVTTGVNDALVHALNNSIAIGEQDAGNFYERRSVRRRIEIAAGGLTATFDEKIDLAVGPNSAIAQQLLSLNTSLAGKADSGVVSLLQSRVFTAEGDIDALDAGLAGLSGDVTALSQAILQTTARVDRSSASGLLRVYSEAASGGAVSRVALAAEASSGSSTSLAAIYLEALSSGQSRVAVLGSQFFVTSSEGQNLRPFVVMGGSVYADNLLVDFAKVRNVMITGDLIATGGITAPALAFRAVTESVAGAVTNYDQVQISGNGGDYLVSTITVPAGVGSFLSVYCNLAVRSSGANTVSVVILIINDSSGQVVYSGAPVSASSSAGGVGNNTGIVDTFVIDPTVVSTTTNTYRVVARVSAAIGQVGNRFSVLNARFANLLWKR